MTAAEPQPFFRRYPRLTVFLFVCFLGFVALVFFEIALRIIGFQPGVLHRIPETNNISLDSVKIEVSKTYAVDEAGIYKFAPDQHAFCRDEMASKRQKLVGLLADLKNNRFDPKKLQSDPKKITKVPTAQSIIEDFSDLTNHSLYDSLRFYLKKQNAKFDALGLDYDTAAVQLFARYLNEKPKTALDSLIADYLYNPINAEGFKSLPFRAASDTAVSVLLVGDSFTFGYSATPFQRCFADLLPARGFRVYNTGIAGTDPAQYLAVIQKYAPVLKPDVVVVNFFMGNDLMRYPRKAEAGAFPLFPTNAGFLDGAPFGEHLPDAGTALRFMQNVHTLPDQDTFWVNTLCAKTVITSKLWEFLANKGYFFRYGAEFEPYWQRNKPNYRGADFHYSEKYLTEMKQVAEANGAAFALSIIPEMDQLDRTKILQTLALKDTSLQPEIPTDLKPEHYNPKPDAHFNNEGMKVYAAHLAALINGKRKRR